MRAQESFCILYILTRMKITYSKTRLNSFTPSVIKGTLANSVDPDQTPQNTASDQGLQYLHLKQGFL